MKAFIVRPFGTQKGIDFDRVEQELIRPALAALKISGGTTGEFIQQGNIRTDMFEQLLIADLVIADISIHNANTFYELGIRHAFSDKHTFLIRAEGDEVPFDLKTDRYMPYDAAGPAAKLPALIKALRDTLDSQKQDSPVFQLLPGLKPADPIKFVPVPLDFCEEVRQAELLKNPGYLQMLSAEADGFAWTTTGLRLIGHAQFKIKDWPGARVTWEAVRKYDNMDLEANTLLGTIYQRLGILTENTEAALDNIPVKAQQEEKPEAALHVILFTGHRIDAHGRQNPRFPPDREDQARTMIIKAVSEVKEKTTGRLLGISGGASGGDILFHEVCGELNIPTQMYLVIPKNEYIKASVADSGPNWVERFNRLFKQKQPEILSDSGEMPRWLHAKKGYSIWERSNLWMLHSALAISQDHLTLIALWNGEEGDGPGGTKDMVQRAQNRGATFIHLDARKLVE